MATTPDQRLAQLLFRRIEDAGAKQRLEELLRDLRKDGRVVKRATGTYADLRTMVPEYVAAGLLSLSTLASLVDSVEESGSQHIFPFRLTTAGRAAVTAKRIQSMIPQAPTQPTEALYADLPSQSRVVAYERDGRAYIKQIHRAEFWELSADESAETPDRRTVVYIKKQRRAVNLFVLDPKTGNVEVRIDRVKSANDDAFAMRAFEAFVEILERVMSFDDHLRAVPIWEGFSGMAACRDDTFMTVDDAEDATIRHRLANRREDRAATDIRDHPAYDMGSTSYARNSLGYYWVRERRGTRWRIHTFMSREKWRSGTSVGKIYLAARLDPSDVDHVVGRIRSFAS